MAIYYNSLTVVLEHDISEEDAEKLLDAIHMLRGVLSVAGNIASINSHVAEARAKSDIRKKLHDIIYES